MNAAILSIDNNNRYIHDSVLESYIQNKIECEDKLIFAMKENMILTESDYSNIKALHEAKVGDKAKARWKRFIAFIKSMIARFMESMTNILLDEKEYLEKYKEIILKKKPKEDIEYSYTGNYTEGIKRLINTEVPMFDYYKFQKDFESDDIGDLVETVMKGTNFHYDEGKTLSEQFKSYFLVYDDGVQKGKLSDLNMTDLYNFCYNFNKIKNIVDKDRQRLEELTRAIESAINKQLSSTTNEDKTPETDKPADSAGSTQQSTKEESALLREAEEKASGVKITDNSKNNGNDSGRSSSDPISKMTSTGERDENAEKKSADVAATAAQDDGKEAEAITKAANKWIEVCTALISSKLTACQQIAKDYMSIIRAHVRSYVGNDKKEKDVSPQKGTDYKKNSEVERAKRDADNAKKEADKAANDAQK